MKKILSLMVLAAALVACTQDDPASIDAPENLNSTTSTIVDLDVTNPSTETPNRSFDNTSNGMYHGIAVTSDVSVHAKIWVNVANDGNYNAIAITDNGERIPFTGTPISRSQEIINFTGKDGSFIFDVTDLNSPVATEVILNGKDGYVQTVKDRSDQRAAVVLGTYVDELDPAFTGSWDLITDGTPAINFVGTDLATPIVLPSLTQACIVGPGGAMFIDDVFEDNIITGCLSTTAPPLPPVFYATDAAADPTDPASANEFWAWDQSVDILGSPLEYSLGQSSVATFAVSFGNIGFNNDDTDMDGAPDCASFGFLAVKGVWSWNGRAGFTFFPDPFEFVAPPTLKSNSSTIQNPQSNRVIPTPTLVEGFSK